MFLPCSSPENVEFAKRSGRRSLQPRCLLRSPCSAQACEACAVGLSRSDMTSQQILQEIGNMAMLDHPNAKTLGQQFGPRNERFFTVSFVVKVLGCQENFSNCN